MKYFLTIILFWGLQTNAFSQDFVQHYRDGIADYENQDFDGYLHHFQKSDSLRPNHRVLLYHLAKAYALNKQPEKAFEVLKYRAGFYALDDFSEEKDFSILGDSGLLDKLINLINKTNEAKKSSETVFEVDIPGFHAEGIAFHHQKKRFFLTDIRNGLIYSVGFEGDNPRKELDLKEFGYWSALGIKFDPQNENQLWVTTAAMENFERYDDSLSGRSAVLNFDINNGKLLMKFEIEGNHVFGDLIFAEDGSIIISDSGEPTLYKISNEREEIMEFISSPEWWNLQGIALSESKKMVFVSDYITGIYRIDLETKEVKAVSERNELLRGADGIYLKGDKLIMLQNGTSPKRVASLTLTYSGMGITSSINFPDNALEELDEPTLGVLVGSELYYIANSPWAHYSQEGEPILENWKPIRINKLSIK